MSITMKLERAVTDAALRSLLKRMENPIPFYSDWGNRVKREAQKNARKHSKGGGFWHSIAKSVQLSRVSSSGATIVCNHFAARHKHFGGTISAPGHGPGSRNAQNLAIPIRDQLNITMGLSPSELEKQSDIKMFQSPSGRALMAQLDGDDEPVTLYALVASVDQKAEPWWPDESWVVEAGVREARHHLAAT